MIPPTALGPHRSSVEEAAAEPMCHKPRFNELLKTIKLDVTYHRGAGCYLYTRDDAGNEVEVLDLVGGYGSLLFGHSHPELVAEAQRLLSSGQPFQSQGSHSLLAELLARELARRAHGDYCVVYGNSGTEAVEAGIKHAMLETGSRSFLALENGFHGKTLGSLQFTAHPGHRDGWDISGISVRRVPINDIQALEKAFADLERPAGFLYEPVQGEGGVHFMKPEFARRAAELCRTTGAPLIADECQTGLGRTGWFLASEALGIQPDYIVFSKSLGGGLTKISALLVRRTRYCAEFDLRHTSTFAGDDFSCAIAAKAVQLVTPDFLASCRDTGEKLLRGLRAVAARHPSVISGVRGCGLLCAIEFRPLTDSTSFVLRLLSSQQDLAYLITSHLLAQHRLRVAPTLSHPFVIRLEPSALITQAEIDRTLNAVDAVCQLLAAGNAMALCRHLAESPPPPQPRFLREEGGRIEFDIRTRKRPGHQNAGIKVAWLCHLVEARDLTALDRSFLPLPEDDRCAFLERWLPRASPVVMSSTAVRSAVGCMVEFIPIMLPFTSKWAKAAMESHNLGMARTLVQRGVQAAADLGCHLVSLGQYTSILTGNGTVLGDCRIGVTTGNSYAIALALEAVARACHESGLDPASGTVAVVGATGNIGRTCSLILGAQFQKTLLIGSQKAGSLARLKTLAAKLPNCSVATDLSAICKADVVVAATNSASYPLDDHHLGLGTIVCDLSVPATLRPGLELRRPDLRVIAGGLATLPNGEDLGLPGFPRPPGQVFACMAEAMLLGFESARHREFTGFLRPDQVGRMAVIADRHGFRLADDRPSRPFDYQPYEAAITTAC